MTSSKGRIVNGAATRHASEYSCWSHCRRRVVRETSFAGAVATALGDVKLIALAVAATSSSSVRNETRRRRRRDATGRRAKLTLYTHKRRAELLLERLVEFFAICDPNKKVEDLDAMVRYAFSDGTYDKLNAKVGAPVTAHCSLLASLADHLRH